MFNLGDAARLHEMIRDSLVCTISNEKWQQKPISYISFKTKPKSLFILEASDKVKDLSDITYDPQVRHVHRTFYFFL